MNVYNRFLPGILIQGSDKEELIEHDDDVMLCSNPSDPNRNLLINIYSKLVTLGYPTMTASVLGRMLINRAYLGVSYDKDMTALLDDVTIKMQQ